VVRHELEEAPRALFTQRLDERHEAGHPNARVVSPRVVNRRGGGPSLTGWSTAWASGAESGVDIGRDREDVRATTEEKTER
jgi:hypothetical protein